jgi:Ca-activated chloride channel family protein
MRTHLTPGLGLRWSNALVAVFVMLLTALAAALVGCDRKSSTDSSATSQRPQATAQPTPAAANEIEVVFLYGSEKQKWVDDVTADFNAQRKTIADGRVIRVKPVAAGSGESKDDLLAGRVQAHLWSPASGVFVRLGNAESQAKGGQPLVGATKELVLSPVVIAMWKPMAEALGWPDKPIGWSDVIALAKNPQGWAAYGRPEFGQFKFGHTHPEYSNSGLISVLAEAYAGAGKVRGLSLDDVRDRKVAAYVRDVEQAVVHYGRSTGFFGRRLFEDGPGYLSAAVLYENMVIESYTDAKLSTPLVAIYPKEGTIWSDHPVGVVQREWVTDAHKEAAEQYVQFLRGPPQQAKALRYGFRPAEGEVGAPLDAAHGVNPQEPKTILELPTAEVTQAAIELWRKNKKHSNVVVVFDKSGSMNEGNRIVQAREGAKALVQMLGDEDKVAMVPFSTQVTLIDFAPLDATGRNQVNARIDGLLPDGQTNLYEAVATARKYLNDNREPGRIHAIVVLTDGEDNGKRVTLEMLLNDLRGMGEREDVRVFTIGYGGGASMSPLKKIAAETRAMFYEGKPENILNVFRDIATFF